MTAAHGPLLIGMRIKIATAPLVRAGGIEQMRNIRSLDPGPGYTIEEFEWLIDAEEIFSLLVEMSGDTSLYDMGPGYPCRWDRADGSPITYLDRRTVKVAENLGYLEARVARLNERIEIDIFVPTEKGRQLAEQREGRTPCIDESVWVIAVERPDEKTDYFLYFGSVAPEPEDVTGMPAGPVRYEVVGPGWSWRIPPRVLGLTAKHLTTLALAPLSHAELRSHAYSG